jgi:hypothetical protein
LCYYTSQVSCPYFEPLEPLTSLDDRRTAMLPLGAMWAGVCRANPDQPFQPADSSLLPLCNLGYAREVCRQFPSGNGPDAVRFNVRGDDGALILLTYVLERDHHPFAHGPLEYSMRERSLRADGAGEACEPGLARQARAYVESYLRRKAEASGQ